MSQLSKTSGYDIRFGGGVHGLPLPNAKALHRLAEAELQRTAALRKFVDGDRRSAPALSGLIDILVDYDKIRYGRMWKPSDADRLTRVYRQMLGAGDPAKIDFSALGRRHSGAIRKITKARFEKHRRDGGFIPFDGPGGGESSAVDVDPAKTGWYYEKHFDYTGGYIMMRTFETSSEPTIGGDVSSSQHDTGSADGYLNITAETGRWFNFTAARTGYPEVANLFDVVYGTIIRRVSPRKASGGGVAMIQRIDGCVGLLSGDEFVGRLYLELHENSNILLPSSQRTVSVVDNAPRSIAGFLMNGGGRIEAGERVEVLFGVRSKIAGEHDHCDAGLTTEMRAIPTALWARTVDKVA